MFLAPQQSVCSGVEFSRYLLAAGAIEVARFHIHSVHCHLHLCPGLGSNHKLTKVDHKTKVSSHNGLTNPLFVPFEMEWYTASLISIKCQVCFFQRINTSSERPRKVQQLANSVTAFPSRNACLVKLKAALRKQTSCRHCRCPVPSLKLPAHRQRTAGHIL